LLKIKNEAADDRKGNHDHEDMQKAMSLIHEQQAQSSVKIEALAEINIVERHITKGRNGKL
jgi:hypothetical protein